MERTSTSSGNPPPRRCQGPSPIARRNRPPECDVEDSAENCAAPAYTRVVIGDLLLGKGRFRMSERHPTTEAVLEARAHFLGAASIRVAILRCSVARDAQRTGSTPRIPGSLPPRLARDLPQHQTDALPFSVHFGSGARRHSARKWPVASE